jgi:hypothetical protein
MKIAIIGFSPSSYNDAPWDDDSWEKWGMPWDGKGWQRYTRLFEMHDPILWDLQLAEHFIEFWDGEKFHRKSHRPQNYYEECLVGAAQSKEHKLYVQKGVFERDCVDNVGLITYPFSRVVPVTGDYFQSSIAYVLALAITEMVQFPYEHREIGIYGVDVSSDEEWAYQRACIEYLIGLAKGHGIHVRIPESSSLLKFQDQSIKYGACDVDHTVRYGNIVQPQVFKRWTLGEGYSLEQLSKMDLPKDTLDTVLELLKDKAAK